MFVIVSHIFQLSLELHIHLNFVLENLASAVEVFLQEPQHHLHPSEPMQCQWNILQELEHSQTCPLSGENFAV